MKFALLLRENLVPEWRDQYFNYKLGKKKLKKLVGGSPGIIFTPKLRKQDSHDSSPLKGTAPATPQPELADPTTEYTDRPRRASKRSLARADLADSLPYVVEPVESAGATSLALPPPAIEYSGSDISRAGSIFSGKSSDNETSDGNKVPTQLTDRSPLLNNNARPSTYRATHSANDLSTLRRRAFSVSSTSDGDLRKQRSLLVPTLSPEEQKFIDWVDSEVRKIDEFYCEKEKDAIKKFLVLQDQLIQLQIHRSALKRMLSNSSQKAHKQRLMNQGAFGNWGLRDILAKLDLSIPLMLRLKFEKGVIFSHEQHGDYSRKANSTVPYTVAKHRLKSALNEYYRSLELLGSYKSLNATAIRKMVKKFDKQTHNAIASKYMSDARKRYYFLHSDVLSDLTPRTEDLYAYYFEHGSHKIAVEKLRSDDFTPERVGSLLRTGFFLGTALPLFVLAIIQGVRHLNHPDYPDTRYLLQIWGGFVMVNMIMILFTINMWIWTKYKINYPFIFELNPRTCLDYKQFGELPALSMFLLSFLGWFSLNDFYPETFPGKYFPPIYLGICVVLFLLPLRIFYWRARRWLIVVIWRLLVSGLVPVEFRDFFMGDIMCSLNYSISNASFFFCLYATYWKGAYTNMSHCSSTRSRLLGFLNTLPGIWRFLQCWRRFGDTGDWWPHLANALKYSCLILYYMFLSLARINHESTTYHVCFILFAAINAIYSSIWDICMDFSLFQFDSKNFLLRDELAFPSKIPYYAIMVIDPILRFNWIFYAIFWSQIEQSAKVSFFVSLVEVFRRFLWVFFRVENEHSANVGRYRASRDVTLPYEKSSRTTGIMQPSVSSLERRQAAATTSEEEEEHARLEQSPTTPATAPSTESPRRIFSLFSAATPVVAAVSMAMKKAHTADFERRKPNDSLDDEDEDNELTDEEVSRHNTSNETSAPEAPSSPGSIV